MTLRAIVFDFDGVIANSEPLHFMGFRDVLDRVGVVLTESDYYARYLGYDDAGVFRAIAAELGLPLTPERLAEFVRRKAARVEALERDTSVLFPGAAEAIRRTAAAVPVAIASGALDAEIRRVLDAAGLTDAFRAIVAADHTSRSKPAPDPYLKAVELLSESLGEPLRHAECVAIEDSHWGLLSAKTAGLRTVGVAQTYDSSALSEADLVIPSIEHLDLAALERLCAVQSTGP